MTKNNLLIFDNNRRAIPAHLHQKTPLRKCEMLSHFHTWTLSPFSLLCSLSVTSLCYEFFLYNLNKRGRAL